MKKLLFIAICASLAACHTNHERYDNVMQTYVSTAMAESHHSESDNGGIKCDYKRRNICRSMERRFTNQKHFDRNHTAESGICYILS